MRCARASRLMSLHLDGMLKAEEIRELCDHLVVCQDCHEKWEALRHAHSLLSEADYALPPPDLQRRIVAQIPTRCSYDWFSRVCIIGVVGILILHGLGLLPVARVVKAVYRDPTVVATFVRDFFDLLHAGGVVLEAMELVLGFAVSHPGDLVMVVGYLALGLLLVVIWRHLVLESVRMPER